MAFGDVWEIAIQLRNLTTSPVQCAILTWHVEQYAGVGTRAQLAATVEAHTPVLMADLSSDCVAEGCYLTLLEPIPGVRTAHQFAAPIYGGTVSQALPTAVAMELLHRTGLRGRDHWGRTYVPWLDVSAIEPGLDNTWTTFVADDMTARFAGWRAQLLAGSGAGDSWLSVVYSRYALGKPHHWTPIISSFVVPRARARAKRGRTERPCRPFSATSDVWTVATLYPSGVYDENGGRLDDGRTWALQSDLDPRVGTPGHSLTGLQIVGYDDSWWNRRFFSVEFPPACDDTGGDDVRYDLGNNRQSPGPLTGQTPNRWWPAYHYYGDAGPGDMVWAYPNETAYARREFVAAAGAVSAELTFDAVDHGQAWLNGTLLASFGGDLARDSPCNTSVTVDATAALVPGGLNCLSLSATQLAETIYGPRGGPPTVDFTGCGRNCAGYGPTTLITCQVIVGATFAAILRLS